MTEENQTHTQESKQKINWHEKYNKHLLIISVALVVFSIFYLIQFNAQNGDLILKDVSLTGGTTITVFDQNVNVENLKPALATEFPDLTARQISDIRTGDQQGFFVESSATPEELKPALENYLGYTLDNENSSTEFTGSSLSSGFYHQLRAAIIIAFLFMAIVVFVIFRSIIPSLTIVVAALADMLFTIVTINFLGISLSIAGVVALLMLIGYSVDTNILLTSRVLKRREGTLNERIFGAFKTGITMTLTSIAALSVALIVIYSFSDVLRQVFTILLIGLGFDIFNTWIMNASILRWHIRRKNK